MYNISMKSQTFQCHSIHFLYSLQIHLSGKWQPFSLEASAAKELRTARYKSRYISHEHYLEKLPGALYHTGRVWSMTTMAFCPCPRYDTLHSSLDSGMNEHQATGSEKSLSDCPCAFHVPNNNNVPQTNDISVKCRSFFRRWIPNVCSGSLNDCIRIENMNPLFFLLKI